jgi:hypothetical protein
MKTKILMLAAALIATLFAQEVPPTTEWVMKQETDVMTDRQTTSFSLLGEFVKKPRSSALSAPVLQIGCPSVRGKVKMLTFLTGGFTLGGVNGGSTILVSRLDRRAPGAWWAGVVSDSSLELIQKNVDQILASKEVLFAVQELDYIETVDMRFRIPADSRQHLAACLAPKK